jgi:hypothetical protein
MDDLDRLYRRLAQTVRESYPQLVGRPFQLADVTHHLVPYRHHRRELGLDSVQAYERALMRLAAGERGYLAAAPEVQHAFRAALQSPTPDAELLRAHGEAMVSLAPEALQQLLGDTAGADGGAARGAPAEQPASHAAEPNAAAAAPGADDGGAGSTRATPIGSWGAAPTPREEQPDARREATAPPTTADRPMRSGRDDLAPPAEAPPRFDDDSALGDLAHRSLARLTESPRTETHRVPAVEGPPAPVTKRPPATVVVGGPCRYCGQPLPEGRPVTFCPACGQNVTLRHCPACSTELEIGWRFCITCGREVDEDAAGAPGRSAGGGGSAGRSG